MDVSRINRLKAWIEEENIEALLIEDPIDLFYLTGLVFSLGKMLVSKENALLFLDGRYIEQARKTAPCEVLPLKEMKEKALRHKNLTFDSSFTTFEGYVELKNLLAGVELNAISKPLKHLRGIKDPSEIEALKKAASLTRQGYHHIASFLKEGISEEELAIEFECYCRRNGASKLSFSPIIAFGENSAYPHHRAGKSRLKQGDIVLFDLGAVVDGYAGDMTRIVFFGEPPEVLRKDYELIYGIQKKAIQKIKPGFRFGDLDLFVRKELEKQELSHLFTHGLSHGIGLEVHEYPRLKIQGGDADLLLKPGMVFTVEPGIYRVGIGGIRYEDVVLVTEAGYEEL